MFKPFTIDGILAVFTKMIARLEVIIDDLEDTADAKLAHAADITEQAILHQAEAKRASAIKDKINAIIS